jgi:hypothetical protein
MDGWYITQSLAVLGISIFVRLGRVDRCSACSNSTLYNHVGPKLIFWQLHGFSCRILKYDLAVMVCFPTMPTPTIRTVMLQELAEHHCVEV